jgi:hypothetical protein
MARPTSRTAAAHGRPGTRLAIQPLMKILVLIQMVLLVLACAVDELGPEAALSGGNTAAAGVSR